MPWERLDIKTLAVDGYYEHTATRGIEIKTVEEKECLWQEIVGELKTNKGEVLGIGTLDYGTDLKRIIGDPYDLDIAMEVDHKIGLCMETHPEVTKYDVEILSEPGDTVVSIRIQLDTIYGIILEVLDLSRGC